MKPIAVTESPSTFWLSRFTPMNQMTDATPMTMVDVVGVWKRGLTVPNVRGIAPQRAMDSDVRAVGRIVVCVEAAAELSTAMMRILSSGEPNTCEPSALSTSFWLSISSFVPPYACAENDTIT